MNCTNMKNKKCDGIREKNSVPHLKRSRSLCSVNDSGKSPTNKFVFFWAQPIRMGRLAITIFLTLLSSGRNGGPARFKAAFAF